MKIFLCTGTLVLLGILTCLTSASAAISGRGYLYETSFLSMGYDYITLLNGKATDNLESLESDKRKICQQRYGGILNDGILDIRIALGYFDWTTGSNVHYGRTNYGLSPSMDLGAFFALRELLLSRCGGNSRFCNFSTDRNNSALFTREVSIHGKKILARIEIQFSSASELLDANLGKYREQQKQRTQFMENYFHRALSEADAVLYFGHSRNGGGPDFSPPVFVGSSNKVNYKGYYEVYRPGFKKLLTALSANARQAPVLGLMSCASRDHFLKKTRAIAPETGVITSLDVLNVDEVYTAMIGAVDALLRGQCQKSFYQSIRMTQSNQKFITMDGMFE